MRRRHQPRRGAKRGRGGAVVSLQLESIAQGGDSLATLADGRRVFVDGGLPGQKVLAQITKEAKRFAKARVLEQPPLPEGACPHAPECGGCRFQGAAPDEAGRWKAEAAASAMQRLARSVDWPKPGPLITGDSEGWRRRARFVRQEDGRWGFRARGEHRVVPLTACAMLTPALESAWKALEAAWADLELPALEIHLDEEQLTGRVCALILAPSKEPDPEPAEDQEAAAPEPRLAETLLDALKSADGVDLPEPLKGLSIQGAGGPETLAGVGYFEEELRPGWSVSLPVGAFRQAHSALNVELQGLVLAACAESGATKIVDLYAGAGNLSLALALEGREVVAVEGYPAAVEASMAISAELGDKWRAVRANLSRPLEEEVLELIAGAQLAIVDPPRSGLSGPVKDALIQANAPERLVMVSCDPGTCARDVAELAAAGWSVKSWRFLDMFPYSAHIETVVVLDR